MAGPFASTTPDWAAHSGDAWTRRWRDIDIALSELGTMLDAALAKAAPAGPFDAFDIGCGAGSTSAQLLIARPEARIVACDLSPSLIRLAQDRFADRAAIRFILGDAPLVAAREGPFDLVYSRHGVMFFDDPAAAFRAFNRACRPGATLLFTCFQSWRSNPWASELANAAAGQPVPVPGREPSGFAFSDTGYVRDLLGSAGWVDAQVRPIPFVYVAGTGEVAVDRALDFLSEIGPAARVLESLPPADRPSALDRMRRLLEGRRSGDGVEFEASAWLWCARAAAI